MPADDAIRWNNRYLNVARYNRFERPRPFLIESAGYLPESGLALDVAMGLGGNAEWLLARGLRVIGVDVSDVALRRAQQRLSGLMAVQADLPHFHIADGAFDIILNFYFLHRSLWRAYEQGLHPGGLLVFETLTRDMLSLQPDIDPEYLLAPGELRSAFPALEIVAYHEGWVESDSGKPRAIARLLARKPL